VPLEELLKLLIDRRFGWRFANQFRFAEGRTAAEIKRLPQEWRHAAQALEDATGVLLHRWEWHRATIAKGHALIGKEADFVHELVGGDEGPSVRVGGGRIEFAQDDFARLRVAIVVLQHAAATVEGLPVDEAGYDENHRIFVPGRRRSPFEASAAEELVVFFRHHASRPLYEHVGRLLAATFPSLSNWRRARGKTRWSDYVKVLIGLKGRRRGMQLASNGQKSHV
jgi:hypothetical protein